MPGKGFRVGIKSTIGGLLIGKHWPSWRVTVYLGLVDYIKVACEYCREVWVDKIVQSQKEIVVFVYFGFLRVRGVNVNNLKNLTTYCDFGGDNSSVLVWLVIEDFNARVIYEDRDSCRGSSFMGGGVKNCLACSPFAFPFIFGCVNTFCFLE
ncbi:unnamed protein product [Clavelina lepadiformis]|uniref:Uncharacterized protein n=1 Tax=Clavelina lepadiformis TaxID=159417 RepID=A0ABP0GHR3_CLALP